LWVPPPHPLNIIRLCLWMFMGLPALREYYQFVSDPYVCPATNKSAIASSPLFHSIPFHSTDPLRFFFLYLAPTGSARRWVP
jgi:hypothetical protein